MKKHQSFVAVLVFAMAGFAAQTFGESPVAPVAQTGANKSFTTLGITVTNPGSGYTSAPSVTITPNAGLHMSVHATATVSDGKVESVFIASGGSGYSPSTPPTISFSGGGGSGAAATAAVVTKHDDCYWSAQGVGVPSPSPRFTDNKDGTVTDNKTGLIWLANTNAFGEVTWEQAMADCSSLVSGSYGLTDGSKAGEWRLPNINELRSLCNYGYRPALPNDKGDAPWGKGPSSFLGFQTANGYWTSTPFLAKPGRAWAVNMGIGLANDIVSHRNDHMQILLMNVWAVRGKGTNSVAPVARTGAKESTASSGGPDATVPAAVPANPDDAYWAARGIGVPLPSPRFTNNKNGTITDNKTGLIWLANADAFGAVAPDQAISACNNLAGGSNGLTDGSKAGDWRLPNINELQSLCNYGYVNPVITNDKGDAKWTPDGVGKTCSISGVQSGWYWVSTTTTLSSDRIWAINLGTGTIHFEPSMADHVWPVRGGK